MSQRLSTGLVQNEIVTAGSLREMSVKLTHAGCPYSSAQPIPPEYDRKKLPHTYGAVGVVAETELTIKTVSTKQRIPMFETTRTEEEERRSSYMTTQTTKYNLQTSDALLVVSLVFLAFINAYQAGRTPETILTLFLFLVTLSILLLMIV